MSSAPIVDLMVRRAGTTHWVPVDPHTPEGQRLLSLFRITNHPEKETVAMSTMTATAEAVHRNNVERMGALVAVKKAARSAFDTVMSLPRAAWAWVYKNLHLQAAGDLAGSAYGFAKTKIAQTAGFLGRSGMSGLALMAVSTETGRSVLKTVTAPFLWLLAKAGALYEWVENSLSNQSDGGIRNAIAGGMATVRRVVAGWLFKGYAFTAKHVAPYFGLETLTMRTARVIGGTLVGLKAVSAVALLPFGGFPLLLAQVAVASIFALDVVSQGLSIVNYVLDRGVTHVSADDDVEEIAHMAGKAVVEPGNRAERRAAAKHTSGKPATARH